MSSQLTTLVPVLTGPNYQEWVPLMQSFLMAGGLWRPLAKDRPILPPQTETTAVVEGEEEEEQSTSISTAKGKAKATATGDIDLTVITLTETERAIGEAQEKWDDNNTKALGSIRLRLSSAISYKYRACGVASEIWFGLEAEYGSPGISSTFLEFKGAMETIIPANSDPTPALNKFDAHFARLTEHNIAVSPLVQGLILMTKIPSSMDTLTQLLCQDNDMKNINVAKIRKTIILAWSGKNAHSQQNRKGGQQANKLSTVKCGPNEPSFQQQQQGGESSRGGRGGSRGGK